MDGNKTISMEKRDMYDRPMIRYNHPGDLNTWFIQAKEDDVPSWAVNVEDYDPEAMEEQITLADEIAQMTIEMESAETPPSYQDVYTMLLRAMLEIRRLQHRVKVLDDLNKQGIKDVHP